MLFDDYFYPGNPGRRTEVFALQGQIRADFLMFTSSWNDCANILNPILLPQHPDLQLQLITCSPDTHCVQDCLTQFQSVVNDAKPKFDKLLSDIGVSGGIAGMVPGSIDYDPEAKHKINQFIAGAVDVSVAAFAAWYTYNAVQLFTLVLNYASVAISGTASLLGGVLGGMFVGAVGFVITDLIASAITGAIERKQLNSAIDALTQFRDGVADPLLKAAGKLAGITQAIKDGTYRLSNTLLITRIDNSYTVITLPSSAAITGISLDVLVHLQGIGDAQYHAGEWAGTMAQSRRLEGFQIAAVATQPDLSWEYMAHLENIGDVPWVPAGSFVGTRAESRRLEGFAIRLTGAQAANYTVTYQAHLQDLGNSAPVSDGAFCGTRGQSRRVEAIYVTIARR
jgi:hypothetical protein